MAQALLKGQSGGGGVKYNVFCRPDEPSTKQGIWLKTAAIEAVKKIVFDTDVWTAETWRIPSGIAALPYAVQKYASAVYGSEIFYFGGINSGNTSGLKTAFAYNPATNTFRTLAQLPVMLYSAGAAVYNGEIFLFGGRSGSNLQASIFAYNPSSNTFRTIGSNSFMCDGPVCEEVSGEIFLFGGGYNDGAITTYKRASAYNPTTNTMRALANTTVANAVGYGTGRAYKGKVYLFGGRSCQTDGNSSYINLVWCYDPVLNTYTAKAGFPSNLGPAAPSCVVENEAFFIGGLQGYGQTDTCRAYNFDTDTYRSLPALTTAAGCRDAEVVGNFLYSLGGCNASSVALATGDCMALTVKQYPDNNTVVVKYVPGDISHVFSLITDKLCAYLPSYFKDAMLFKDANLLYPELYTGDGVAWTKIRGAQ